MLDEQAYKHSADAALSAIQDAMDDVDAAVVDCERAGDVITLTFSGGLKCIVNTQRPTRQLWLAARDRAWHFDFDAASGKWLDDKGRGDELFATLARIVKENAGLDVAFVR